MTRYSLLSLAPLLLISAGLAPAARAEPAASAAVDVRSLLRQALRVDMELELDPPSALERASGLALAMRQAAGIDVPECQPGRKGERNPINAMLACANNRGVDLAPFVTKGIAAWLASFDPQARVYSPDDLAQMGAPQANGRRQDIAGQIGISLQQQGNVFAVVGVLNGMPADAAGITRYMRIVAIDGISVSDMTLDQGIARLRGTIGSTVSLTVLDGKGSSRTVSLVRQAFTPRPPRLVLMEHGRIGLVVTSGTPAGALPAIAKSIVAANPAPSWIILDLRQNSGGILQDYIATADVFLSQGRIVTVHGHPDEFYDAHAVNDPAMALPENVPLVVLVDHVTAAGAELVAAALQDHRRATIIGQKTFGRGSVQTLLMLGQGWAMKMTTGYLARPDGPSLEYGVKPDCISDLQDQALIDWVVQRMARGEVPCRASMETPLPPAGQAFLRNPVDLPPQIPQRRASPHGGG